MRSLVITIVLALSLPRAAMAQHIAAPGSGEEVATAPPVAQRLFRDLVCTCGGCQRLPLSECRCAMAKEMRGEILGLLKNEELGTREGENRAYIAVRDHFMKEYGGQRVLTVPLESGFNRLGLIVPLAVTSMAGLIIVILGRRWVRRGRAANARRAAASARGGPVTPAQEDLEDRLDDELRDLD